MQNDFNQNIVLTEAGTTYSDWYELKEDEGASVDVRVNVTAIDGTGPSLVPTVQFSDDKVVMTDFKSLQAITTAVPRETTAPFIKRYARVKLVLAGTTPEATLEVFMQAREGKQTSADITIINTPLTASTEEPTAIPEWTGKVLIKARAGNAIQLAFAAGESNSVFISLPVGSGGLWFDAISLRGKTVYAYTTETGEVLEMLNIT